MVVGHIIQEEHSVDKTTEIKRYVRRNFKKGDMMTYIDARNQKTYTHEYQGLLNRGGYPYAKVHNGKELLILPMYQLVLDM